jgi:hypothetical protein
VTLPRAEVTGVAGADLAKPDLGLGVAGEQAIRRYEFVCVDLVCASFDVDGDKLALVLRFHLRADLALVDLISRRAKSSLLYSGAVSIAVPLYQHQLYTERDAPASPAPLSLPRAANT